MLLFCSEVHQSKIEKSRHVEIVTDILLHENRLKEKVSQAKGVHENSLTCAGLLILQTDFNF